MHAIFQKATVKDTMADEKTQVLAEFAHAVASRPFDLENVQRAANQIKEKLGLGAMIEASSSVGGMEMAIRVVDATGKKEPSSIFKVFMSCVMILVRVISIWFGL